MTTTKTTIRAHLTTLVDPSYQQFQAKLVPEGRPILGVRIPVLRTYAKQLKGIDEQILLTDSMESMEEVLLIGMLIGTSKKSTSEKIEEIHQLLPLLESWEETDLIASSLKFLKKEPEVGLALISFCLHATEPYIIRFGLVLLLNYFVEKAYLPMIFDVLDHLKSEHYYVRMAAAWLLSYCYIYDPDTTNSYFQRSKLDRWTYQKAIQKCLESRRVSAREKEQLRKQKQGTIGEDRIH